MTEEDFWKKFFSSHYLHRDKNITDAKDLFTDCGKQDEQGIELNTKTQTVINKISSSCSCKARSNNRNQRSTTWFNCP